jgi:hypothetical protein
MVDQMAPNEGKDLNPSNNMWEIKIITNLHLKVSYCSNTDQVFSEPPENEYASFTALPGAGKRKGPSLSGKVLSLVMDVLRWKLPGLPSAEFLSFQERGGFCRNRKISR